MKPSRWDARSSRGQAETPFVLVPGLPPHLQARSLEVDAFTEQHALAPLTRSTYDGHWQVFASVMEDLRQSCLPATEAGMVQFVASVVGYREAGESPLWSASYTAGLLAAVREKHKSHGYPDPLAWLPPNAYQDLMLQLKKAKPRIGTAPVTPEDLRRLAALQRPRSLADCQREVALHLHLASVEASQCAALLADLRAGAWASLEARLGGALACACSERNLAAGCLRCSLAGLGASSRCSLPSTRAFLDWVEMATDRLDRSELDDAGRGLLLVALARPRLVTFLRQRAWYLMAFDRGLRAQDVRGLLRRDVVADGEGWRITVRRGKNDPLGESVSLSVLPQSDAVVCPVTAVGTWLNLRDAACADPSRAEDGYAFCATDRAGGVLPYSALDRQADLGSWRRWARWARLGGLTQHGLRSGFIVEAARQGHSLDKVQYTSRHQLPTTTEGYFDTAHPLRRPRPRADGGVSE